MSLHDDLDFFVASGFYEATAWSYTVFFGAGGLDFEGDAFTGGVCQLHCNWDVLSELKPADTIKDVGKEGLNMFIFHNTKGLLENQLSWRYLDIVLA